MRNENEEIHESLPRSAWLSVLDSNGNVIHETWHNSIRKNEQEWTWELCPRSVSIEGLFAHVARILFENPDSYVIGYLAPEFNQHQEVVVGC